MEEKDIYDPNANGGGRVLDGEDETSTNIAAGAAAPAGAIDDEIDSRFSATLQALEKLRVLLDGNEEVSVPGVVVTGAQSAGKSSVLEALGGIQLPRGQNITTRVPLVLSLQASPGSRPHAIIGREPDLSDVRTIPIADTAKEIEALTAELAGSGAAVSNRPIYLKVTRPGGPTLTLIDLPGITHISADDSQDIHKETVSLVESYIRSKNMVILVVIPAMDDFANAEAIALSRKYDPDGSRTLGVVTKTDNIREGSGIKAKLRMEGKHVSLHLGFVAVVNRTPVEVETNVPTEEVRARERHFFQTNTEVSGLGKQYWGMDTLVSRIVAIQAEKVRQFIPEFVKKARVRTKEIEGELKAMPPVLGTSNQRWDAFCIVCSSVREGLNDMIRGNRKRKRNQFEVISDVTRMYRAFATGITKEVVPDFFSDSYYEQASGALKRVDGMTLSNFLAGQVFHSMIPDVFEDELNSRSDTLVEDVRSYMQKLLETLTKNACAPYPSTLVAMMDEMVQRFLDEKEQKAQRATSDICRAEISWTFTQNDLYNRTRGAVNGMMKSVKNSEVESAAIRSHGGELSSHKFVNPQGGMMKSVKNSEVESAAIRSHGVITPFTFSSFQDGMMKNVKNIEVESAAIRSHGVEIPLPKFVNPQGGMMKSVKNSRGVSSHTLVSPKGVYGVPAAFIRKMIDCIDADEIKRDVFDLQVCLHAYSSILCKNMFDVVPKQVQFWLVDGICGDFVSWMLNSVDDAELEQCFAEDHLTKRKRAELELKLRQFKEGLELLRRGPTALLFSAKS